MALLPAPAVVATSAAPTALIDAYAVPLVGDLLLAATGSDLSSALWHGGPTAESVLSDAGLITTGPYTLKTPLPDVDAILGGVLQSIAPVTIPLTTTPPLSLEFVDDSGKVGVRLLGSIPLSTGAPAGIGAVRSASAGLGPEAGVTLYLLTINGARCSSRRVDARGLGIGVCRTPATARSSNASGFRLGAVDAYLALRHRPADRRMSRARRRRRDRPARVAAQPARLELEQQPRRVEPARLGLERVRAAGDTSAVNPAVDVIAYYLDGALAIEFAGTSEPVVIPSTPASARSTSTRSTSRSSGTNTVSSASTAASRSTG